MDISNIEVNTQSSIKLIFDKIVYFDPYKIEDNKHDADIIFITHNHYDHMDVESIEKIKSNNTIIVAPKSMEEVIKNIELRDYILLNPYDEINIDNFNVRAIPAYNNSKTFHPKENNWLGYIVTYNNVSYYIAGDTDKTEDNEKIKCDIAFIPIGGHFTMDVKEAEELVRIIKPKVVVPIHYGSIVGSAEDGEILRKVLADTNIEVMEKLNF